MSIVTLTALAVGMMMAGLTLNGYAQTNAVTVIGPGATAPQAQYGQNPTTNGLNEADMERLDKT